METGSRLTEIVIDGRDPVALAGFWAAALGYHGPGRPPGSRALAGVIQVPAQGVLFMGARCIPPDREVCDG